MKAHKGGRTERLYIRITKQSKDYLESKGISIADWIEQKIQSERIENGAIAPQEMKEGK